MALQYRNPPIIEAIFECHFDPSESWGLHSPARLFDSLQETYPAQPTLVSQGNLEVITAEGVAETQSFRISPQTQRYQFSTTDGLQLVRVARDVLSVHVTAPYPGWKVFRARIEEALSSYIEVATPRFINRIGIRYVNRIEFQSANIDVARFFRIPLEAPDSLEFSLSTFFLRFEAVHRDSVKLIQNFASTPGEKASVILDLDVIKDELQMSASFTKDLMAEIDSLREIERDAFEASITPELREVFNATDSS